MSVNASVMFQTDEWYHRKGLTAAQTGLEILSVEQRAPAELCILPFLRIF